MELQIKSDLPFVAGLEVSVPNYDFIFTLKKPLMNL